MDPILRLDLPRFRPGHSNPTLEDETEPQNEDSMAKKKTWCDEIHDMVFGTDTGEKSNNEREERDDTGTKRESDSNLNKPGSGGGSGQNQGSGKSGEPAKPNPSAVDPGAGNKPAEAGAGKTEGK